MAALELRYFESNVFKTPKKIAVKILKWIINWKRYILLTLWWRTPSQLQVFLFPTNFELYENLENSFALICQFSLSISGQTQEFFKLSLESTIESGQIDICYCQAFVRYFVINNKTDARKTEAWLPTRPGCQKMFQNGGVISGILSFFRGKFFKKSGTLEAETTVSGKLQCLLVIGEDKSINVLEWTSPLNFAGNDTFFCLKWSKGGRVCKLEKDHSQK